MDNVVNRLCDALGLAELIGSAPLFVEAVERIGRVAKGGPAVLIHGETGAGKELAARAIHYLSVRGEFPFIAVNCGSLPDTLLEGELFGHERGAFTDAHARRAGLVAQADGGTLFLDEVDSLSGRAQGALLRFLQEKTFRPVGSSAEQHADVRIVAATNADLSKQSAAGRFRSDLYYRLDVFRIQLPPLRDRRADILPLAIHFLNKHAPAERSLPQLASAAEAALLCYSWPGNVRELESAMIRASHLCQEGRISLADLDLPISSAPSGPVAGANSFQTLKREAIDRFERDYLGKLLKEYGGNITQAAAAAGKARTDLCRLLKRHRMSAASFRPTAFSVPR